MARVVNLGPGGVVVYLVNYRRAFVIISHAVVSVGIHEGIEVAALGAVLIGKVGEELAVGVAQAQGEAVGGLPVGVVGGRGYVGAVGVEICILESVGVVHGAHVVVAQAECHLGSGLVFQAELDGADALECLLGVLFHYLVAAALRVVGAPIAVVVVALFDARVGGSIVGILVNGADGEVVADGVAQ